MASTPPAVAVKRVCQVTDGLPHSWVTYLVQGEGPALRGLEEKGQQTGKN